MSISAENDVDLDRRQAQVLGDGPALHQATRRELRGAASPERPPAVAALLLGAQARARAVPTRAASAERHSSDVPHAAAPAPRSAPWPPGPRPWSRRVLDAGSLVDIVGFAASRAV